MLHRYNQLLQKYEILKNENTKLRNLLSLKTENKKSDKRFSGATVTQHSSSDAKIALFRSLFCGREDVFARRWYSKTTEKSGYQPVCGNEWADGLCDKRKYKCSTCPNRKLMQLTDNDIFKHLAGKDEHGRDVIGIYPMLKDETCNFLCVDFDEEDYENAVTAFRVVCEEFDVPLCVERSRSGNGAHIWIFFATPVSAVIARKLGSGLLTKAMESNAGISFKSYDRLFPNQDTMPEGGFGNLIALPLQGKARKDGNSVFVDEKFFPYEDQWAYLSRVQRLSSDKIEELVSKLCKNGELGTLVSDYDDKPWKMRKETILTARDFSNKITVVKANMLYVPTADISSAAQNAIKRLAAFRNPDFYCAQAMSLPIYDKPRVICTAEITEEYIGLPRGCENALCKLFEDCNVEYFIDDKTNCSTPIPVNFNGVLREEQQPAADALLEHNTGVLSVTTAFGKTVIASYLIGKRKVNTLILVHTQSLMQQWKRSLENFLDLEIAPPLTKKGKVKKNWSPIGVLGAGKNTLHGNVDVAVMQSLVSGDEVKSLVRSLSMNTITSLR